MTAEEKPPYVRLSAKNSARIRRVAFAFNMTEVREHKPTTLVDIAADGDVILVVGPEKIRLRVHSLNLKATSKPFSAMLGPIWKEGRDLLQDGSVELPLQRIMPRRWSIYVLLYIIKTRCCLLR